MEPLYFEDYRPDLKFCTKARTITETDLVNFVGVSGMFESLFIDREYVAAQQMYEGQLVPGALTYAISEGLVIQEGILHGRGLAFLGLELRAEKPVYVGDTIHVEVETAETRETRRADRGIVITDHRVVNQKDDVVMSLRVTRLVRTRPE